MALFKCKMCGGTLEINNNETVAICEYCGTQQTLPKLDADEKTLLYERANHFRRNNEYDLAMSIYEQIRNADPEDAEVYWSLVLCRYGIEYVEDGITKKRIPTVNRAQFTSIFDDEDYNSALQYADILQREIYINEAKSINEIQKGILAISQKEKPFDVFICYKESDATGRRTLDSVLAYDLYQQLTNEGYKVFFSRVTLEDKLGIAYEPYIFAALNSAKVMLAIGTKAEYFNAPWVKNEWSRYLALVKKDSKRVLIPVYRDMDPYDLPREFMHLQAQDMAKLGFVQDLLRGISKIIPKKDHAGDLTEAAVDDGRMSDLFLTNAFVSLKNGDFSGAESYVKKVLESDSENPQAYVASLMIDLKVREPKGLADLTESFENNPNYVKILQYGDKNTVVTFKEYLNSANKNAETKHRKEKAVKKSIKISVVSVASLVVIALLAFVTKTCIIPEVQYQSALSTMDSGQYQEAIAEFEALGDYKECSSNIVECTYNIAIELMHSGEYQDAISTFEALDGYKDSQNKIIECNTAVLDGKYNDAIALMHAGKYTEAIDVFEALGDYEESTTNVRECNYNIAIGLMNSEQYEKAVSIFDALGGYKDSPDKKLECKYAVAIELMNSGEYQKASSKFDSLGTYKDSEDKYLECSYTVAIELMNSGEYQKAMSKFISLGWYKDSLDRKYECEAILDSKYNKAIALMNAGRYDEAIAVFATLGDYKYSENKIAECLAAIRNGKYN